MNQFVAQGMLIVVSGCSGSGKNSVLRRLIAIRPDLVYSVSATTRPPRPGEIHGRDYFFLTTDEFQATLAAGGFLESARVYDHFYGTPRAFIEETTARGQSVVLDVDIAGALNVRVLRPDAVLIFLLPPTLAELRHRLTNRRTDSPSEIEKRLAQADIELQAAKGYDYVVVNRDIETAVEEMRCILVAESLAVRRLNLDALLETIHEEDGTHRDDQPPAE